MSRTAYDLVSPPPSFESLPICLEQAPPAGSTVSRLLLLMPAVLALAVPGAAVALASTSETHVLAALAARPVAAAQIAAGIVLWVLLFIVPASRSLARLWRRRLVTISQGSVEIADRTLLGWRRRHVPLADYRGLAHHIRASLSGLTHEIVLVHAERRLTVTLTAADRITQGTLDRAKQLLGLPEVPARTIYERTSRSADLPAAGLAAARA